MEMHQLRYVVAVAKARNFSRAAENCHVSQPSLSQQVQKLEDELGERLFDRLGHHVQLTAAGVAFAPRAERILAEADAAKREAQGVNGVISGRVNIGALPTIAPYLLPDAIAKFTKLFPGVEVVLHEETTSHLLKMLSACELEFAIVSLPINDPQFAFEVLLTEELLLALTPRHPLNQKSEIQLQDLSDEPFILMKEGHCLGDQVLDFCTRKDFHPKVSCRSAQIATIQALVRAGMGVSIIPKMASTTGGKKPNYRSLEAPSPTRTVVATWLTQRPLGRAGMELVKIFKALGK